MFQIIDTKVCQCFKVDSTFHSTRSIRTCTCNRKRRVGTEGLGQTDCDGNRDRGSQRTSSGADVKGRMTGTEEHGHSDTESLTDRRTGTVDWNRNRETGRGGKGRGQKHKHGDRDWGQRHVETDIDRGTRTDIGKVMGTGIGTEGLRK